MPVKANLQDVPEKLAWARRNPRQAEAIAQNGKRFATPPAQARRRVLLVAAPPRLRSAPDVPAAHGGLQAQRAGHAPFAIPRQPAAEIEIRALDDKPRELASRACDLVRCATPRPARAMAPKRPHRCRQRLLLVLPRKPRRSSQAHANGGVPHHASLVALWRDERLTDFAVSRGRRVQGPPGGAASCSGY